MNERPIIAVNDPGLATIRYRPARYADVKAAMVRALSDARRPGLLMLGARDDRDLTIALIDAFAVLANSVGFYVERSAREAWLRTAEEPLSIRMLARQVGYELRPRSPPRHNWRSNWLRLRTRLRGLSFRRECRCSRSRGLANCRRPSKRSSRWSRGRSGMRSRRGVPRRRMRILCSLIASRPVRWVTGVGLDLRPGRPVIHVHQDNTGSRLAADSDLRFLRRLARVTPERDLGRTRIEFEPPPGSVSVSAFELLGFARHPAFTFGGGLFRSFGTPLELEILQIAQFVTHASPPPPDPNGAGVFVLDVSAPLFAHDRVPGTKENGLGQGPGDSTPPTALAARRKYRDGGPGLHPSRRSLRADCGGHMDRSGCGRQGSRRPNPFAHRTDARSLLASAAASHASPFCAMISGSPTVRPPRCRTFLSSARPCTRCRGCCR